MFSSISCELSQEGLKNAKFYKTSTRPIPHMDKTKLIPILYLGQEVTPAGILKSHNDVTENNE